MTYLGIFWCPVLGLIHARIRAYEKEYYLYKNSSKPKGGKSLIHFASNANAEAKAVDATKILD